MSVSSVLRNIFSRPYATVSAAQAAALADGGAVLLGPEVADVGPAPG